MGDTEKTTSAAVDAERVKHGSGRSGSISARVRDSFDCGVVRHFFTSYDVITEKWRSSALAGIFKKRLFLRIIARIRRTVAASIERSTILRFVSAQMKRLLSLTLSYYGTALFFFGVYTSIIYLICLMLPAMGADMDSLITGVSLMLVSLPLLLSRKTLAEAISESRIARWLVFSVFGFRREDLASVKRSRGRADVAFIVGMILGFLTFYVDPLVIISGLVAIPALYILFLSPEAGVVVFFTIAPLISAEAAVKFIFILAASYFLKLIRGRRTFSLDAADFLVFLFGVLLYFAGKINYAGGNASKGVDMYVVYILFYFIAVNLIKSEAQRERCRHAAAYGAAAVAVLFLARRFAFVFIPDLSHINSNVVKELFSFIEQAAENAAGCVLYLVAALPLFTSSFLRRRGDSKPLRMFLFAAVSVAAVVYTLSRGLWLGAAGGLLLFLFIYNFKYIYGLIAFGCMVPIVMFSLPQKAAGYLAGIFSMSGSRTIGRVIVRRTSLSILKDNWLCGVGRADGLFSKIYSLYTNTPHFSENSQNLYIQIGIELGVAGLIVFFLAMLLLMIKAFTAVRFTRGGIRLNSAASVAGFAAMLIYGMTDYIWADPHVFLIFFMFAAFVSAYNSELPKHDSIHWGMVIGSEREASIDI